MSFVLGIMVLVAKLGLVLLGLLLGEDVDDEGDAAVLDRHLVGGDGLQRTA